MKAKALDAAVAEARANLVARGIPAPQVFLFLATGAGLLPTRLRNGMRVPLGNVKGVPTCWRDGVIVAGELAGVPVWILEDTPGSRERSAALAETAAAWEAAFPCWLAASAGAAVMVHTSAGVSLASGDREPIARGTLALATDHVNFSGRTPLLGIGESKLGPLFPDQTQLHDTALRQQALATGKRLGLSMAEGVVACTCGPALETAAERRFWARAGADLAVSELAAPLIASAHAGLAVLSIIAVTDTGDAAQDFRAAVASTEKLAPAIEDLIVALAPDLARAAAARGMDE